LRSGRSLGTRGSPRPALEAPFLHLVSSPPAEQVLPEHLDVFGLLRAHASRKWQFVRICELRKQLGSAIDKGRRQRKGNPGDVIVEAMVEETSAGAITAKQEEAAF